MNRSPLILHRLESINEWIGRTVSWLALTMVVVQFVVVGMRYVFGVGSIMMQESIFYMHGILFMVGAGYTLLHDGHVRIDIFYREATPRRKALVDLAGVIAFLIPVSLLIWWVGYSYVASSWAVFEGSKETSGIQGVFLLKTVILVFAVLIPIQGIALAIRSFLILTGGIAADEGIEGRTETEGP